MNATHETGLQQQLIDQQQQQQVDVWMDDEEQDISQREEHQQEEEEHPSVEPIDNDDNNDDEGSDSASTTMPPSHFLTTSIFYLLGIGLLVPWNAFVSAKPYFTERLCGSATVELWFGLVYNASSVVSLGVLLFAVSVTATMSSWCRGCFRRQQQQPSTTTTTTTTTAAPQGQLRPICFCGPSGVGKGTLIELLMKRFPGDQFGFSVSHTTRNPRDGETDGVHYHFTTVPAIEKEIAAAKFIEYAEVHGRYYGTSVASVESVQSAGKVCILDIDFQGVQNVKKSSLDPIYVFIAPPSMEELEQRLRGRGTEKEEDVQKRLAGAAKELEYGKGDGNFDKVFVNDDLTKTFEALVKCIKQWYPNLKENLRPRPVVFCGPSGVGKGTLINLLMERFPNQQFGFSVSHTTRQPRDGETDGVHYNFTTVDAIQKEIADDKFVEYANVHGNYYGTSVAAVETVQSKGRICVLDIDFQGVQNVKKSSLSPIYLFVAPPSMEELEKRLRGRGTEKEEDVQKRLAGAAKELQYGQQAGNFDRVFVNADLNATFDDMALAFKEWYPQLEEVAPDDEQKNCTSCVVS